MADERFTPSQRVRIAGVAGALIGSFIALYARIGLLKGLCAAYLGGMGGMVAWLVVGEVVLIVFRDHREWGLGSLPWKIDKYLGEVGLPRRLTNWLTKAAMVILIWLMLLLLLWGAASADWRGGERS